MKLAILSAILASTIVSGCLGAKPGKIQASELRQPDRDLMIEPRRTKGLRSGGDLKKYALISTSRNGDLVDQVKGLQGYVSAVTGAPIIKLNKKGQMPSIEKRRTIPPSS